MGRETIPRLLLIMLFYVFMKNAGKILRDIYHKITERSSNRLFVQVLIKESEVQLSLNQDGT